MGAGYLIDTNAVIEYLDDALPESGLLFMDSIPEMNLSVVTRIELLSWRKATKPQLAVLEDFIGASRVYDFSESIVERTIDIRREYRAKLPDAIIAATALAYDLVLVTRNISDFKGISGLEVINAWEIKG